MLKWNSITKSRREESYHSQKFKICDFWQNMAVRTTAVHQNLKMAYRFWIFITSHKLKVLYKLLWRILSNVLLYLLLGKISVNYAIIWVSNMLKLFPKWFQIVLTVFDRHLKGNSSTLICLLRADTYRKKFPKDIVTKSLNEDVCLAMEYNEGIISVTNEMTT